MEVGQLWVRLGLDKSGFDSGVNEAKGKSSGLGGFIKSAFQFTVGMGMFDALKTGIKSAWDASIGFNSQMEQSEAAFTTLLGNAKNAKQMLSELNSMASSTPFELTDLTKASQTLLSFGIDSKNVMGDLKMLGDVSMGNKEKFNALTLAFSQIQSTGKLTGQDLLQLINAGFNPLQIISKQTGESMAELKDKMSKGAISADMVTAAFQSATEKGGLFYGAMDKQSKTFEGQMSTLSDNVKSTLGSVLKPEFENLSNVILPKAINMVSKFAEGFKTGGMAGALKAVFPPEVASTIINIGNAVKDVFGWISQHGELVKTILIGIAAGFAAFKTINAVKDAITTVKSLSSAIGLLTSPMGTTIIIIGLLAAAAYLIIKNWGPISAFFKNLWLEVSNWFITSWNNIKNFFTNFWNWLKSFFAQWGPLILRNL